MRKSIVSNLLLFFVAGIVAYFCYTNFAFAVDIDIPFNADDIGLQNYEGPDIATEGGTKELQGLREDGSVQINNFILTVIKWFRNAFGIVAITWITWQGFNMLTSSGDETKYTTAEKSIMWTVIALVMSFLIEPFVRNVIYGGGTYLSPGQAVFSPEHSALEGRKEIYAVIGWIKSIIGVMAVGMIIFTGIRSMISLDSDDEINNQKRNLKTIMMGIIILIFNQLMVENGFYQGPHISDLTNKFVVTQDATKVIQEASGLIRYVLTFFATLAVASVVYAGYLYVTASIDEEGAENSKKVLKNVIMGVIGIVIAYALVATLINFKS